MPSFDGNVAFIVTSGTPLPGYGYFNLSSVPASTLSPSWQNESRAWWTNQTISASLIESISAVVCSPKYIIEPWTVDLVDSSMTLVERQLQSVGTSIPSS
jgi:hypothetical protein